MKKVLSHVMVAVQITLVSTSLLCLTINNRMFSQISSENVERHFIANARAAALGDGIVADATDVTCMYWNPSSLSFLRERSIVLNYSLERIRGRDNLMNENIVISLLHEKEWTVGLGATYSHVGHIESGSSLAGYSFNQGSLDLALATALSRFFSIGILSTIRRGQVGSRNSTVGSFALGMMYYPSPEISYGLSYQGIGDRIDYSFDPLRFQTSPIKTRLSQSLQVGVTTRFNALADRPTVVLAGVSQKIFGIDGFIYKAGIEGWPSNFLALRIGYWVGTETVAARYGGGLRLGPWQLDYAISTTELEPQFHQASLSYSFSSQSLRR